MGVAPADTLAVGDYKFDVIGGPRRRLPHGAGQPRRRSPTHELADWGSPDMVVKSLRELLPLFGR